MIHNNSSSIRKTIKITRFWGAGSANTLVRAHKLRQDYLYQIFYFPVKENHAWLPNIFW